jgi:rhamnogalacturonyl hydrolase YesR
VPIWSGQRTALLWLRGTMRSYTDWESDIVGTIVPTSGLQTLRATGEPAVTKLANAADRPAPTLTPLSTALEPRAVADAGRRVAHWQLANWSNPPVYGRYGYWTNRRRDWVWAPFYIGLSLFANEVHNHGLMQELDGILREIGHTFDDPPRFADNWAVGWAYADAYRRCGDEESIATMQAHFDELMQQSWDESLEWRSGIAHRELAWCDALYMGPPTLIHLAAVTGDWRYGDFGDRLWWKTTDYLYDDEHHLYYRDSRYFDAREENGEPVFWARGNGWVFAGLTRILDDLPDDYPTRQRYETLYREMAAAIRDAQRGSGYWPTGMLDPEHWTAAETSGTAFFTYGLAWGVNRGLLDEATFAPAVERGWAALVRSLRADGRLRNVQPIGADPYDFDPDSVMPYAVGGFLMAASEVHALAERDDTDTARR